MNLIGKKLLKIFLKLASLKLKGDWILLGGTVLPALGVEVRSTTDIDVAKIGESDHSDTLQLMELAEKLGLPVETINQAGSYFLNKIPDFQKHLVVLHRGTHATFYRPDLYLFVQLKIQRMSESDLQDCIEMIKFEKGFRNFESLKKLLSAQIRRSSSAEKIKRLEKLGEIIKIKK